MGRFDGDLCTRHLEGRKREIIEVLTFYSSLGVIAIFLGFISDLASTPRLLWSLLPPDGPYAPAVVVHDLLNQFPFIEGRPITRKQADGVMMEDVEALGVGWLTRHTVYWDVRVGGWYAWNQHRRQDAPEHEPPQPDDELMQLRRPPGEPAQPPTPNPPYGRGPTSPGPRPPFKRLILPLFAPGKRERG